MEELHLAEGLVHLELSRLNNNHSNSRKALSLVQHLSNNSSSLHLFSVGAHRTSSSNNRNQQAHFSERKLSHSQLVEVAFSEAWAKLKAKDLVLDKLEIRNLQQVFLEVDSHSKP